MSKYRRSGVRDTSPIYLEGERSLKWQFKRGGSTLYFWVSSTLAEERLAIPMPHIFKTSVGYSLLKISKKFLVSLNRSSFYDKSNKSLTWTLGMPHLFSVIVGHFIVCFWVAEIYSEFCPKSKISFNFLSRRAAIPVFLARLRQEVRQVR